MALMLSSFDAKSFFNVSMIVSLLLCLYLFFLQSYLKKQTMQNIPLFFSLSGTFRFAVSRFCADGLALSWKMTNFVVHIVKMEIQ